MMAETTGFAKGVFKDNDLATKSRCENAQATGHLFNLIRDVIRKIPTFCKGRVKSL